MSTAGTGDLLEPSRIGGDLAEFGWIRHRQAGFSRADRGAVTLFVGTHEVRPNPIEWKATRVAARSGRGQIDLERRAARLGHVRAHLARLLPRLGLVDGDVARLGIGPHAES